MTAFLLIYGAIVGACLGSWLTVVWHRVPARRSLVHPGSSCPACGHALRARDNLPIIGYLTHRGRCAYCQEPIPARYLVLEVCAALVGAVLAWWSWPVALGVAAAVIVVPLVVSLLTQRRGTP